MNTTTGLSLVLAIFVIGVAALAILFFGRTKDTTFSRFRQKSGSGGEKLVCWVIGLLGLGLVFISLTGVLPGMPTFIVGFSMATVGFGALIPGQDEMSSRGFLVKALIELVLALACFGGAASLFSQIKDGYGWLLYGLPMLFLFMFGCGAAGGALHDYLRHVAGKALPDVEPRPEVLAELLKPPGPVPVTPPPVANPDAVVLAIAAMEMPVKPPPPPALPGLLAGVVCLSAGMWFRATELVSTEVGYIVGVPLFVYGIVRCGLSLIAVAKSISARRI